MTNAVTYSPPKPLHPEESPECELCGELVDPLDYYDFDGTTVCAECADEYVRMVYRVVQL